MAPLVVFLAAHVKHYRLPFFDLLHRRLREDGVTLRVLYSDPNSSHAARKDNVDLPSTYGQRVSSFWLADRFVYQSAWKEIADADLVITPNEHKLLLNPLLLALRAGGVKRVAYWGKGNIIPSAVSNFAEWLRHKTANAVDWWFPYTDATAENLRRIGVSCGITPIGNATDTLGLHRDIDSISQDCLCHARCSVGVSSGAVGIFCGNLSANKHLDFLFTAGRIIRAAIPTFSLLMLGNGPLREHVQRVATRDRFIHFLGPRIGREKALLLKLADVFLLPGAVGLAILDSFAAGLPLLTTELPDHGPEISYLSPGNNGLITLHDPQSYADATIGLLRSPQKLARLRNGAVASSSLHSIEKMVENFRCGILDCLSQAPARGLLFRKPVRHVPQSQPAVAAVTHFPGGQS
jgi:glycosyltransferase involved in cell wall biosynthesis